MPEILIGLLRAFWATQAGQFTFGAAASYSVWAGTASSGGTQGGILDTIWHAIAQAPANILSAFPGLFPNAHKAVRSTVSHWALAQEKAQAAWYTHLNLLVRETYSSNLATASTAADAIERIVAREKADTHYKDGSTVKARATTALNTATKAVARERALSATFTSTHRAQVVLNHRYTHAIDVTIPAEIGGIRTRNKTRDGEIADLKGAVKGLEDGAIDTFKWISTHRTTAAMGVFAGAVAWALSHLGYGFLRCRSWRQLGKRATCGTASSLLGLLDDGLGTFLGALFAYEAVTNLRTLVELGQAVEKGVATGIHDLLEL